MKLNVTAEQFEELIKRGYNLDVIFLLKLIDDRFDVSPLCDGSMKIAALLSGLIRKGLISEHDEKITLLGKELLLFIDSKEEKKIVKQKPATTEFNDWWLTYPGTDTFTHNGKNFSGSRTLRQNKDECRLKYDKILLEGEYTSSQLIEALKFDVLQKKEASLKDNTNKLTYMQNSLTYLNQRSYEPFIELINAGILIKETKSNGSTDI
jgi:hypothetical protein